MWHINSPWTSGSSIAQKEPAKKEHIPSAVSLLKISYGKPLHVENQWFPEEHDLHLWYPSCTTGSDWNAPAMADTLRLNSGPANRGLVSVPIVALSCARSAATEPAEVLAIAVQQLSIAVVALHFGAAFGLGLHGLDHAFRIALLLDSFSLRRVLLHTRKRGNVESYSSQETAVPTDTPVVTMTIAAAMTPASCRPRESWTSTFPVPCRRRKRNNSFSLRLITAIQVKPHLLLPLSQVLLATRSSVYGEHLPSRQAPLTFSFQA